MLRYVTMHNISHAQTSAQSNEISYGRRLILFLYTLCPEKKDWQYFGRNFDKFRQLLIIFGTAQTSLTRTTGRQTAHPLDYHVWGAVLEKFNELKPKSQNAMELKTALQTVWNDLPDETILWICSELSHTIHGMRRSSRQTFQIQTFDN